MIAVALDWLWAGYPARQRVADLDDARVYLVWPTLGAKAVANALLLAELWRYHEKGRRDH